MYICIYSQYSPVLIHSALCSEPTSCLSLTSSQVPANNLTQSDKLSNSHKIEIYNENITYPWESMINEESEFQ